MVRIQEWFVIQSELYHGPHNVYGISIYFYILSIDIIDKNLHPSCWPPSQLRGNQLSRQRSTLFTHKFLMDNYEVVSLCVRSIVILRSSWVTGAAAADAHWTILQKKTDIFSATFEYQFLMIYHINNWGNY